MLKAGANQNRIVNGIYRAITNSSAADTLADSAPSESAISGDWPNNAICMSFPPSSNAEVIKTNTLRQSCTVPALRAGTEARGVHCFGKSRQANEGRRVDQSRPRGLPS